MPLGGNAYDIYVASSGLISPQRGDSTSDRCPASVYHHPEERSFPLWSYYTDA